jgi:hypothetical protein
VTENRFLTGRLVEHGNRNGERHVRLNLHEPLFAVPQFTGKVSGRVRSQRFRFVNANDSNLITLANGLAQNLA